MAKKIVKKIEDTVEQVVEDIKQEANEDVATFTIDRWHVVLAATAVTAILFAIAL